MRPNMRALGSVRCAGVTAPGVALSAGTAQSEAMLQDGCDADPSDHLTIMYSSRAASITLRALDSAAHPDPECTFNPWMIGGDGHL